MPGAACSQAGGAGHQVLAQAPGQVEVDRWVTCTGRGGISGHGLCSRGALGGTHRSTIRPHAPTQGIVRCLVSTCCTEQ